MNIFGNLFGSASANAAAQSVFGQASATNPNALQNAYNARGMTQQASAALAQQYSQAQISQLGRWRDSYPQWMIDGRAVSIEEFANIVYGEDTPEKTMFLLKYTKETK